MALKIRPTPKLNKEESAQFIRRVESKVSVASRPIRTPKLTRFANKLIRDAAAVSEK
ncbi:MAG: hypothetical protein JRF64_11295 [Deltaproteobacteria bacterium]|jgi:hypothetical protein|nr:hypothetical protein [Deltaproteobacteria bacterium]MBW2566237.1 hypothetical protein [Deltaproteobacteria bacterium]